MGLGLPIKEASKNEISYKNHQKRRNSNALHGFGTHNCSDSCNLWY